MRNIENLVAKSLKKSVSQSDLKEWFFDRDPGMSNNHLIRLAGHINEFAYQFKKCKDPQCFLVTVRCGHLGNFSHQPRNRRLMKNAYYLRTQMAGVAEGLGRRTSNGGMRRMELEASKFAVGHPRVMLHDEDSDVLDIEPVSFTRALKQYIINARDEYFRLIASDTPPEKLLDFIKRNQDRVVPYQYIERKNYEALAKFGRMPKGRERRKLYRGEFAKISITQQQRKYQEKKLEQELKGKIDPRIKSFGKDLLRHVPKDTLVNG